MIKVYRIHKIVHPFSYLKPYAGLSFLILSFNFWSFM